MEPRLPLRLAASGTVLGASALLLLPARAFTVTGSDLDLSQRDARVFDNFTDPEANDNTTPDPNWPGSTGVELAVWKGLAEWGSELHGDGSGDPSQPGDVGSGGANFDVTWQGNAPGPGGLGDNVVSEIACAGGVISYLESNGSGWRIRLCSSATWDDGPGDPVPGALDVQGFVCHEYGHALGLGHSNVAGSTMYPSLSGSGVAARSIEADDVAGIQFVYGAVSPSKPHVAAVQGSTTVTVVGSGFAPTGNEVWFTQDDVNPTGEPVRATGVPSAANGTVITLAAPVRAGPGDVLVRVPGAGHDALSNAFPWDPEGCPAPSPYCTAKTNSQGCTPEIGFSGSPSASSGSPFLVSATQVLNNKTGFLIYGFTPASTPFQGGTLCFSGLLRRTPAQNSGGNPPPNDCSGSYAFDFNARIQSGVDPFLTPGREVYAQYYMRDPAASFGVGLTDALAFTVCP